MFKNYSNYNNVFGIHRQYSCLDAQIRTLIIFRIKQYNLNAYLQNQSRSKKTELELHFTNFQGPIRAKASLHKFLRPHWRLQGSRGKIGAATKFKPMVHLSNSGDVKKKKLNKKSYFGNKRKNPLDQKSPFLYNKKLHRGDTQKTDTSTDIMTYIMNRPQS